MNLNSTNLINLKNSRNHLNKLLKLKFIWDFEFNKDKEILYVSEFGKKLSNKKQESKTKITKIKIKNPKAKPQIISLPVKEILNQLGIKEKIHYLFGKKLNIKHNKEISTEDDYQKLIENHLYKHPDVKEIHPFYPISPFWILDTLIILKTGEYIIIEYKLNSDKRVVSQALGYAHYFTDVLGVDKDKVFTIIIQKKFRNSDLLFLNTYQNLYFYIWEDNNKILNLKSNFLISN